MVVNQLDIFFDKDRIITFESIVDLENVLETLDSDLYNSKLDAIKIILT